MDLRPSGESVNRVPFPNAPAIEDSLRDAILLTPGPLTTSGAVREAMLHDRCTWDVDYRRLTSSIRQDLVRLATKSALHYSAVPLQGSGTFMVESVLTSGVPQGGRVLVLCNGAYGERMAAILARHRISHTVARVPCHEPVRGRHVRDALARDPGISHVAAVHCETTSGVLNPLPEIVEAAKDAKKTVIVDAMSSFGGYELDVGELSVDALVSSANKCVQGVPGVAFCIAKRSWLESLRGNARTLSLDLFHQWATMEEEEGKWRFTSPTHVVAAFRAALDELLVEGVSARAARYRENHRILCEGMDRVGFRRVVEEKWQSHVITSFQHLPREFSFPDFYDFLKRSGFIIYPGKLSTADTFRIGSIGAIFPRHMERFIAVVAEWARLHGFFSSAG